MKLLFALFALLALPSVSMAQDFDETPSDLQTGTRLKMPQESMAKGDARAMQKDVARCMAYRNKKLVGRVLETSDPSTIDYSALGIQTGTLGKELKVNRCLSRAAKHNTVSIYMRFNYNTFRNLLAEEVYLMNVEEPLVLEEGAPEKLSNRYFAGGVANSTARVMADMGDCFSYNAAAEGDAFLRTRPGTSEERDALAAMLPKVGDCIDESTTDIDISMTRKIVADGLWSRYHYGAQANEQTDKDDA